MLMQSQGIDSATGDIYDNDDECPTLDSGNNGLDVAGNVSVFRNMVATSISSSTNNTGVSSCSTIMEEENDDGMLVDGDTNTNTKQSNIDADGWETVVKPRKKKK